jgi:hypothetical protein
VPLPYFTETSEVVNYLIGLLNANLTITTPPLVAVYYGMEDLMPTFPAASVVGGRKDRTIDATHRYELILRADIVVFHEMVQSATLTRAQVDLQTEAVETLLLANTHATVGGVDKVIFGSVTRVDPGQAALGSEFAFASRLRWEALSRQEF